MEKVDLGITSKHLMLKNKIKEYFGNSTINKIESDYFKKTGFKNSSADEANNAMLEISKTYESMIKRIKPMD